jgi:hypothetical protein
VTIGKMIEAQYRQHSWHRGEWDQQSIFLQQVSVGKRRGKEILYSTSRFLQHEQIMYDRSSLPPFFSMEKKEKCVIAGEHYSRAEAGGKQRVIRVVGQKRFHSSPWSVFMYKPALRWKRGIPSLSNHIGREPRLDSR